MVSKDKISKDLGISRKTLYNYMNILNITDLSDNNINIIREFISNKNKSRNITKSDLLSRLDSLTAQNIELLKQNEILEKGQQALLEQIEYYRTNIDNEIRKINNNITLLLNPPKIEKKGVFSRIFKS